jgi:hypothetical protein
MVNLAQMADPFALITILSVSLGTTAGRRVAGDAAGVSTNNALANEGELAGEAVAIAACAERMIRLNLLGSPAHSDWVVGTSRALPHGNKVGQQLGAVGLLPYDRGHAHHPVSRFHQALIVRINLPVGEGAHEAFGFLIEHDVASRS